ARTDTRIGVNPVSVASTAVRLAQDSFAPLADSTVLLIGAGETIELAARHLVKGGVRRLLVANRTLAHAQALAQRPGGYALPLTELDRHLAEADIVFSATAAREPVLLRTQVEAALAVRRRKPVLLFDLAVPRDIEAGVAALDDAYLYTVDDLERAVEDNRRGRHEAAEAAEAIIDLQVSRFMETVRAGERQDTLRRLRAMGDAAREEILARARQQLASGRDPDEVLQFLAHTLTNRLLHPPTAALREAALAGDTGLVPAADRLFPARAPYSHPAAANRPPPRLSDHPEPAPHARNAGRAPRRTRTPARRSRRDGRPRAFPRPVARVFPARAGSHRAGRRGPCARGPGRGRGHARGPRTGRAGAGGDRRRARAPAG